MFNLIVSSTLENDRIGYMTSSRMLEYTEPELRDQFKDEGTLRTKLLMNMPTIFMDEGTDDEIVRIGNLTEITKEKQAYRFNYSIDTDTPPMTNGELFTLAPDLQINEFEFSRNHWSIKNVDLFQVLYRNKRGQSTTPKVFTFPNKPQNPHLISVMMPFDSSFSSVYQAIQNSAEILDFDCKRADDFWRHDHIIQDVIELIHTARIVICDLSGKNSNVFYETGIAHAIGKDVILLTQNRDDIPFDLRSIRYITYLNNQEGLKQLEEEITSRVQTLTT